jgi:hypothetical protein
MTTFDPNSRSRVWVADAGGTIHCPEVWILEVMNGREATPSVGIGIAYRASKKMALSLAQLIPNVADLLALEVEEVARVLLIQFNSYKSGDGSGTVQHSRISQLNFFNSLNRSTYLGVPQEPIKHVPMEAWAWLRSEGLIPRSGLRCYPWMPAGARLDGQSVGPTAIESGDDSFVQTFASPSDPV